MHCDTLRCYLILLEYIHINSLKVTIKPFEFEPARNEFTVLGWRHVDSMRRHWTECKSLGPGCDNENFIHLYANSNSV